jgi:hypothetical protein
VQLALTGASLLAALGHPAEGGVVQPGQAMELGEDDLLVASEDGRLVVRNGTAGRMVPERPVAVLRGAREAFDVVQALLDRCSAAEART